MKDQSSFPRKGLWRHTCESRVASLIPKDEDAVRQGRNRKTHTPRRFRAKPQDGWYEGLRSQHPYQTPSPTCVNTCEKKREGREGEAKTGTSHPRLVESAGPRTAPLLRRPTGWSGPRQHRKRALPSNEAARREKEARLFFNQPTAHVTRQYCQMITCAWVGGRSA